MTSNFTSRSVAFAAGALTAPALLASVGSAKSAALMMGTAAPTFNRFKRGAFELPATRDGADARPGQLANEDKANRAEGHHPIASTALLNRTQPGGEHLAIYPQ